MEDHSPKHDTPGDAASPATRAEEVSSAGGGSSRRGASPKDVLLGSWPLLILLLAIGVWTLWHAPLPWTLWIGDDLEYADIARRLARGEGFTTGLVYPVELEHGLDRDHPSLVRPPLWPIVMAGAFLALETAEWTVHAVLLVLFVATVGAAIAMGLRRGGVLAGVAAGMATTTSPELLTMSAFGGTELLLVLLMLLIFLVVATDGPPLVAGALCALAYLTRYNAGLVLPFVLLWAAWQPSGRKALLRVILGFGIVALPWWLRNSLITGNPLFTYYKWGAYFSPFHRTYTTTLMHMIEPDLGARWAMHPLDKFRILLPELLKHWPLLSANAAACIGVALGCLRRDRTSLLFAGLAIAWTLLIALALGRGRYFVPLLGVLLALGAINWVRFGGRVRLVGLAFLLAAPLLPPVTPPLPDLPLLRAAVRSGQAGAPQDPWAPCIAAHDLVVAERASRVAWVSDATTVWLPATKDDFWHIVTRYPVRAAYVPSRKDLLTERFFRVFVARPECGTGFYQRREATSAP